MLEFLKKLNAVLFYAAVPLLIPFFYSLIKGDGGWVPIGITIAVLALPAIPQMILALLDNIANFIRSMISPETPFNYATILSTERMRKEVETLTLGEILTITSVAWLLVPLIGTLPYLYYGVTAHDAFFESMSGWTSTGLSALQTLEGLPESIILFRSVTQWIGGLGIAVLILTAIKGKEAAGFLKAEGRSSSGIGIGETVSLIFRTYLVLSVIGILLLVWTGMGLFDSVNLAFSGISNGGFFPFDSFEFSDLQKIVLAMLMFGGATSVLFFRKMWNGELKKALLDEEFIFYVLITVAVIALIVMISGESLFNTVLNTISSIACGGFAIGDLSVMHAFPIYLLILLMLSGGMLGSTTGGIKLWRLLVMFKAIVIQVKSAFLPAGSVQVVKINSLPIENREVVESGAFIFSYLLLFLFGAGVFLASDFGLQNSLFLVASAMGNVGLSTVDIAALGVKAKAFLMFLMYLGRIEIFPSLALIRYILRR